jgi:hypothetical protein
MLGVSMRDADIGMAAPGAGSDPASARRKAVELSPLTRQISRCRRTASGKAGARPSYAVHSACALIPAGGQSEDKRCLREVWQALR